MAHDDTGCAVFRKEPLSTFKMCRREYPSTLLKEAGTFGSNPETSFRPQDCAYGHKPYHVTKIIKPLGHERATKNNNNGARCKDAGQNQCLTEGKQTDYPVAPKPQRLDRRQNIAKIALHHALAKISDLLGRHKLACWKIPVEKRRTHVLRT